MQESIGDYAESRLWSKGTREMETVTKVNTVRPYILEVTFSDGVCKQIDLAKELYGEVFEPLQDPGMFSQVAVDEVLGTIVWPNGADLSPEFLYNWRA